MTVRQGILEILEFLYAPVAWRIPDDFLQFSHYQRIVLNNLEWTSSPGYPYMLEATTNGQYFGFVEGAGVSQDKLMQVWELVKQRLSGSSPDPIRLFIKPEPHKEKKILKKAFRLISSVSVVDQIIDQMLFGTMNDLLVEEVLEVPSKAGWTPYCGGWKIMPVRNWMSMDKSGWDWTARLWLFHLTFELRKRLCRTSGPLLEQWVTMASRRYAELFVDPLFITSGGTLLRQKKPGVMKSGSVLTISDNSIMQVILHLRVCLENDWNIGDIYSMGDDTIQERPDNLEEYLEKIGQYCIVKDCRKAVEFAGHRFEGSRVEPLYLGKHAFQLLHANPKFEEEIAESYRLLYHRSSKLSVMASVLEVLNRNLRSSDFFDRIYDGGE